MLRGIWRWFYLGRGPYSLVAVAGRRLPRRNSIDGAVFVVNLVCIDTLQMLRRHRCAAWFLRLASGITIWATADGCAYVHGFKPSISGSNLGPKAADSRAIAPTAVAPHATQAAAVKPPMLTPVQSTSPRQAAQAKAALARGLLAYHRGDYASAARALKQAILWQPFLAPAHLALGKIYLLEGLAADDDRRLVKGRRLVEMAQRLDPTLTEAAVCLLLFVSN